MKYIIHFILCIIAVSADPMGMRTGLTSSQLESKIFYGYEGIEGVHLYMASLQSNQTHVCGAGMFKIGFLISSGRCIFEIGRKMSEGQDGSAVLGNTYLTEGTRYIILKYATHPDYGINAYFNDNHDAGIVMIEATEHLRSLSSPPLPTQSPNLGLSRTATICGWGASEKSVVISNQLNCLRVTLHGEKDCNGRMAGNFRMKHFCGSAIRGQKISLGDYGGPLVMHFNGEAGIQDYIIGVASADIEDHQGYLIRFIKSSYIRKEMMDIVERFENEERRRQRDLQIRRYIHLRPE